jgi:hypothetical protein
MHEDDGSRTSAKFSALGSAVLCRDPVVATGRSFNGSLGNGSRCQNTKSELMHSQVLTRRRRYAGLCSCRRAVTLLEKDIE